MSDARDGYQHYLAAKLWSLVPSTYRFEDGRRDTIEQRINGVPVIRERLPYTLRALIELIAEQAAVNRRGHDRLWDDAFIELCDEWAVPYIGELLGTRLLPAADARGRRVDVAKTIYYRRRKGTVRLIEELIADITGWDGVVVEAFRHLGRTHHGLDERPARQLGRFTHTPRGGLADLRDPRGAHLVNGPFDEYAHTIDVRQHRGVNGRWNINRIQLHLYRLAAETVDGVTPFASTTAGLYTFDPSGRPRPLFMRRDRPDDWDEWRSPLPWHLPAPMACRMLNHAEYAISEPIIDTLAGLSNAGADDLRALIGIPFHGQAQLDATLGRAATSAELLGAAIHLPLLAAALVEECGKHALYLDPASGESASVAVRRDGTTVAPREQIIAGDTDTATAVPAGFVVVIDPEHGRFRATGVAAPAAVRVMYTVGMAGPVGAGPYDRSAGLVTPTVSLAATRTTIVAADYPASGTGVVQLDGSATFTAVANPPAVVDLTVQAADGQRPYLRLAADWVITATAGAERRLVLDGLWIGGAREVVIRGAYTEVVIRRCTIDPGSFDGDDVDVDGDPIPAVPVWIEGPVDKLTIDHSITGALGVRNNGAVDTVSIVDSIVSTPGATSALAFPDADLRIERSTVFGDLAADRLYATDSIIDGVATITDTQAGCFRFSAALTGSRVPHRYESILLDHMNHVFTSRRFGDPGFAQIASSAPWPIRRGAESGSEMGAYSALVAPIRFDSLVAKVGEYLPFGLVPIFVEAT